MGYTHYWRGSIGNDNTERAFAWRSICMEASVIVDTYKDILCDYNYANGLEEMLPPKVSYNEGIIRFNGIDENAHETFVLRKDTDDFEFCKTRQKPYDMPVMLVLIVAAGHGLHVSSDGDEEEWQPAFDKYNELFGDNLVFHFDEQGHLKDRR